MSQEVERMTGRVRWFNAEKGYGFLSIPGYNDDIFVHYSAITAEGYRQLSENQTVEFEIVESEKGLAARDVVVLDEAV